MHERFPPVLPEINRRGRVVRRRAGRVAERLSAATAPLALGPRSKVRIGKVYLGREHPGWPMATVDVNADMKSFEASLAGMSAGLADVEFIEGGLIANDQQLAAAKEKFKGADGILVIHLTMGIGSQLQSLMDLGIPVVLFPSLTAGMSGTRSPAGSGRGS